MDGVNFMINRLGESEKNELNPKFGYETDADSVQRKRRHS